MNLVVYWHKQRQSIAKVSASGPLVPAATHLLPVMMLLMFSLAVPVVAQTSEVTIEVVPQSATVRIEQTGNPQSSWSFLDSYGGLVGLGSRVKQFEASGANGEQVNVRRLAPGQFETSVLASRIQYDVSIPAPARASDAALVSWLSAERGILYLSDILPLSVVAQNADNNPTAVRISVPAGWGGYSDEEVTALRTLRFTDLSGAVIVVGKNLRRSVRSDSGKLLKLLADGDWAFSNQDALDTVAKIIKLHSQLGAVPCGQISLALSTFPGIAPNSWSAETRGCTVTLLMGKVPSRTAALAQLGNALTHELFHVWIPNGVALTGDYDWFYEGFTMYQAARAAVQLGYISFPEFLNAIARAYDGAGAMSNAPRLSLIEASKQRWTNGAASVYSRAMVVAFLYDLNLRYQSRGKRSLDDVYRRLFNDHLRHRRSPETLADGNAAAIAALRSDLPAGDGIEEFVTAPVMIDLQKELSSFGLRVEKLAVRTHIFVDQRLPNRQRDLLKQLGYNEPRARRK